MVKKHFKNILFSLIVVALACIPLMLLAGTVRNTMVIFFGRCIAYAIVAIGLDMIWGYTGILSLGHGLYFALGAYAMGMYLKLRATGGAITDFMQVGGLSELPLIWRPFQTIPGTVIMLILVPGLLSGLIGFFTFKNRVRGVYFSIISQALTWAAYSLFIALSPYTNGNVGITEIQSVLGNIRGPRNTDKLIMLFYIGLVILVLVYILAQRLMSAKFGKILIAVRDGENRTYFSGYNAAAYKTFVYVLSALFAAVAGAVFINFNGSVTPTVMTISYSVTMVIWVAIGGRGTLVGPVLGAFLINFCEYRFSSGAMVEIWQYIIGLLFIVSVVFFKHGIVGGIYERLRTGNE